MGSAKMHEVMWVMALIPVLKQLFGRLHKRTSGNRARFGAWRLRRRRLG